MTRAHERSGQVARKRRCLRLVYGRRLAATHDSWLPPAQRVQAPPEPAEIWEVSSATRIDDGYGIQLPVTWKRDVRLAIRVRDGRGNEHYGLLYMPLAALLFDHAGPGPHPAERLFRRCEQDVWRAGSDSNRDAEPVGDAVQVVVWVPGCRRIVLPVGVCALLRLRTLSHNRSRRAVAAGTPPTYAEVVFNRKGGVVQPWNHGVALGTFSSPYSDV